MIMNTILIADDEKNIRDGLKCIIDWNALGFEICAEAANGEEALDKILMFNPSLVLLDIRMPKLYGTELIKLTREKGYQGKFIILSGYSDFAYAQQAIRYGVDFYLTKPLDEDELLQAVTTIKASIEKENAKNNNMRQLQRKAKHVILQELLLGDYSSESLSKQELTEMNLDADVYQVVIYEKFSNDPNYVSYSFAELLNVTNEGNRAFEHQTLHNQEVIILKGDSALTRLQRFLDKYEQNPPQIGSPLDSLFLAYGRPVHSLEDITHSYTEAATLCSRRFFCMQGQHTLGYQELPDLHAFRSEISDVKLEEYATLLTDYLMAFNRNKVAETLHSLEEFLYLVRNDLTSVRLFLTDLYLRVKETITHKFHDSSLPFPTNAEAIAHIEQCHYLYEIIRFLSEQVDKVMNATGNPSRNTILDDILYYIDHNYRSNIKLESIAPLFGYNSAYLGKIFSKAVGQSFNSYVDSKRIEESKKLLSQNQLKVYEIAELVGYSNADYFHKKFRKYVGESPAEYRKRELSL